MVKTRVWNTDDQSVGFGAQAIEQRLWIRQVLDQLAHDDSIKMGIASANQWVDSRRLARR